MWSHLHNARKAPPHQNMHQSFTPFYFQVRLPFRHRTHSTADRFRLFSLLCYCESWCYSAVQIFVGVCFFTFLVYIFRGGFAGPRGKSVFIILRKRQSICWGDCLILYPASNVWGSGALSCPLGNRGKKVCEGRCRSTPGCGCPSLKLGLKSRWSWNWCLCLLLMSMGRERVSISCESQLLHCSRESLAQLKLHSTALFPHSQCYQWEPHSTL